MPIRFYGRVAAFLFALNLISGCAGPYISSLDIALPEQSGREYILGSGDVIRISLYGDDSFTGEYKISENNRISLPLVGAYDTNGKTISVLEQDITDILANGYYRDPRISANVVTYRPFYILGEVNKPGAYPYHAGLTLQQAVSIAGGYTYRANERKFKLQRTDSQEVHKVRMDPGIRLGPGDTVEIMERYF